MTRFATFSIAALLCAVTVHAAPAATPDVHAVAASTNAADLADEPTWGATFNQTAWGLEARDFEEREVSWEDAEDQDDDFGEYNEHTLEARAAKPKKIGLASDWASPTNWAGWKSSRVRAVYTWDVWRPKGLPKGIPFWPMLHDASRTKDWLPTMKKGYAKVALGINEPDHAGQANLSPKQGAAIWRKYMLPLKKRGYYLISPSVTSSPAGLKWLQSFRKECPSCWKSISGVALHYYGKDAKGFKSYMTNMQKALKKPIHVTETACEDFSANKCSAAQAQKYMAEVTKFSMSTKWIRSIFWFGMWPNMPGGVGQANSIMSRDGKPNGLGKKFLAH